MQYDEIIVKNANQISRREFLESAYIIDPLVHAVFQQWREGLCTFEQACQQAVLALVAEKSSHLAKVMAEMKDPRPIIINSQNRIEILIFSNAMEAVMAENDAEKKDSWKVMSLDDLFQLFGIQKWKFEKVIECKSFTNKDELRKRLLHTSNYCMMLWHKLGEKQ